jgi:sulfatase maturation enzyme AslB (radical SAM superfamily)
MLTINQITHVELELSSYCNASCPLCPRNLFGYEKIDLGYIKKHLTFKEIKKIFSKEFVEQIKHFTFEGNFGDPLMNPEILNIIEYLDKPVKIFTNASLQTENFWKELAKYPVTVYFAIDGLEDTHCLYRRNTDYNKILKNASTFISAGGDAVWKMIRFDHNKYQIIAAENLSKELGFSRFEIVDHGRNSGPVFDSDGNLEDILGNFDGSVDIDHYINLIKSGDILIEDIYDQPKKNISCLSKNNSSIYVSSTGEVYPCCFMGFGPATYGHGRWHQPVNRQIQGLIKNNNALEHSLEECIDWFNQIPGCWQKKSFEDGRLIVCDASCGMN